MSIEKVDIEKPQLPNLHHDPDGMETQGQGWKEPDGTTKEIQGVVR